MLWLFSLFFAPLLFVIRGFSRRTLNSYNDYALLGTEFLSNFRTVCFVLIADLFSHFLYLADCLVKRNSFEIPWQLFRFPCFCDVLFWPSKHIVHISVQYCLAECVLCSYCCKFLEFQSFPHCKRSFLPYKTKKRLFWNKNYLHVWQLLFFAITNGEYDDFYFEIPNGDKTGGICLIYSVLLLLSLLLLVHMFICLTTCLSGIRKASFYIASLQLDFFENGNELTLARTHIDSLTKTAPLICVCACEKKRVRKKSAASVLE